MPTANKTTAHTDKNLEPVTNKTKAQTDKNLKTITKKTKAQTDKNLEPRHEHTDESIGERQTLARDRVEKKLHSVTRFGEIFDILGAMYGLCFGHFFLRIPYVRFYNFSYSV
jgi:hypothetical protein